MKALVNARLFWCAALALALCFVLAGPAAALAQSGGLSIEDLTTFERWQYLAAFLPFVVSVIIQRGWTKEAQTKVAIVVYVIWGLFGALISGEFVGLTFDTAINVADSIMKVIIVGFVSYQTLWKAFPLPDKLEEATGGDPLVHVVPNKNVA